MTAAEMEAARLREALERMAGRSPLSDWLRQHRSLLEARFAVSPPRWAAVAGLLAELGVRDAAGHPPTARTVRQAWYRVRTAAVPEPARQAASSPAALAAPSARPAPLPPATPATFDPTEGACDPPARFPFRPVRPR